MTGDYPFDPTPPKAKEKLLAMYGTASLRRLGISEREAGSAQAVLGWLIKHANPKDGRCDPSVATLAFETGYSLSAVKRALLNLSQISAIDIEHRGRGRSCQYHVYFDLLAEHFLEVERQTKHRSHATQGWSASDLPTWSAREPLIRKVESLKEDIRDVGNLVSDKATVRDKSLTTLKASREGAKR